MLTIQTERLQLLAASLACLEAELYANEKLGECLRAHVPQDWPPGEYDHSAIEYFMNCLSANPDNLGWYSWYAVAKPTDGHEATVIGAGGYMGPPDQNGQIEIGYSIVTDFQGKGYATELVRALVEHAGSQPTVRRIVAHTAADNIASQNVLQKCGFTLESADTESGENLWILQKQPIADLDDSK
jgi:[ribosomal protein S5]-alanine N-acetyltransferase